jgi:hypothetical protein
MLLGLVLCATAQAATDPVEAPDIEAKVHAGAFKIFCADTLGTRQAWGVASIPANLMFVDNSVCFRLRQPFAVDSNEALAILAVTHEMTHLWWRSVREAPTECFALFIFRWEARHNYGATARQANELYDMAWSIHQRLSPAYTAGCARLTRDPVRG